MATIGDTTRPEYIYDQATDTWIPVGIGPHSHTPAAIGAISSSVVTTKGDLIVATGSGVVTRQGVGADGSYLVADSTQADGLNWAGPSNMAGRNAVLNSNFSVWQRGTSFASQGAVAAAYTADRWHFYRTGGVTGATLSRQTSGLTGIQYCARLQRDSGNTNTSAIALRYTLESADSYQFAGKTVTVSFYARAGANYSATSNAFTFNLASGTGTDQPVYSFTSFTTVVTTTATLTTSWQRFTVSGTVGSSVTELGIESFFTPTGTAGANDYFEITGVQLEVGSVATPYAPNGATYQAELAACQRYYFRTVVGTTSSTIIGWGRAFNTTLVENMVSLPVSMRIYPTSMDYSALSQVTGSSYNTGTWTLRTYGQTNSPYVEYLHGSAVFTAGQMCSLFTSNGYIGFSAEL